MTNYACIFLPLPPSTNNLFAGKARRFKSKAYKAWLDEAALMLNRQDWRMFPCEPVDLTISVERASNRKQDVSNRIKAVEDLLSACGVIEDDSQVRRVTAQWHADIKGCRVEIESAPDILVRDEKPSRATEAA